MLSKNYFASYYATLAPKRPFNKFIGQRLKIYILIVFVKQFNGFQVLIKKIKSKYLKSFYLRLNTISTNNFIVHSIKVRGCQNYKISIKKSKYKILNIIRSFL